MSLMDENLKNYKKMLDSVEEKTTVMHHIPTVEELKEMKDNRAMFIGLPISKEEILSKDISNVSNMLRAFEGTNDTFFFGKLALSISGYDFDSRELHEIKEVRQWFYKMIQEEPNLFIWAMDNDFSYLMSCMAVKTKIVKRSQELTQAQIMQIILAGGQPPATQSRLYFSKVLANHIIESMVKYGEEIAEQAEVAVRISKVRAILLKVKFV